MYVFLSILRKYIAHVNTLTFIPLGDFETGIPKNLLRNYWNRLLM